ncbi:MAG: acyltransferase [Anaerolineales bacterium]|nr:acyltransferase [Anaerolineales bacterium]
MKKEIPGIAAVRAIAALLIVNYHTKRLHIPVLGLLATGGFILNIIFVGLSGYLLMIRYQHQKIDRSWYQKRLLRIYPSYWLSLIIILTITIIFDLSKAIDISDFLVSLTGFQYFFNITTFGEQLWFVTLILVCYISFDLTRNLVLKYRYGFILFLFSFFLALALIRSNPGSGTNLSLNYGDLYLRISAAPLLRLTFHYLVFAMGMFVAYHVQFSEESKDRKNLFWVMISLLSFVGYFGLSRVANTALHNFLVIFLALICSYAFIMGIAGLIRSAESTLNRLLNFIASISYEIYLIHFIFVTLFQKYLPGRFTAYLLVFALSLISAYLIKTISSRLSKPFTRFYSL